MGNGRRLKEELGDQVKIVAAEPMQGEPVQGLRSLEDGFIPPIIDLSLLDRKIFVTNTDAIVFTRKLLDEEGLFVGRLLGGDRARRGADRRRARRGQRRVPRRRRRLEVPLVRHLHASHRGDREPGLHRLVVSARECAATPVTPVSDDDSSLAEDDCSPSGAARWPRTIGAARRLRIEPLQRKVHNSEPVLTSDVDLLNRLLDLEHVRDRGLHRGHPAAGRPDRQGRAAVPQRRDLPRGDVAGPDQEGGRQADQAALEL